MKKNFWCKLIACALVVTMASSFMVGLLLRNGEDALAMSGIRRYEGDLNTNWENYLNGSVAYKLPSTVKETDEISLIIRVQQAPLLDTYRDADTDLSFTEYAASKDADAVRARIEEEKEGLLKDLDAISLSYERGADYSAVLSGFEIVIKAGDFETVCEIFGDRATTIVSEVYEVAKTQLVENTVDVYDTGIFDSSDFKYDGTGVVVAVLDTGLDYYHSAFSVNNFTADRSKLGLTFEEVAALIGETRAAGMQSGLTASDVYINEKVPFSFDYADEDSDVYPINSDHGTHVAGIIAGKDDVITGVAPNAQLVIMKTFSDVQATARASWILAALDDCVVLGVDVINMSLGTGCGFSRETDKEALSGVYDRVREAGISLICAASNSYNSTYGSERNGNLGLTSNPDSATVSSPGTYDGAMSVASIKGAKTPYLLFNDTIIYFNESSDRVSEEKVFVDDLLKEGQTSIEIEYVTIPGAGRSADYTGVDVRDKIVLVRRGSTTFEEKANVAQEKGAAGIIIYNNVSGDIKMNVGDTTIAVCSIRQDDGEMLAAAGTGVLKICRSQASGPFMSDFSSWGPTPDLGIKPEITAHGGSILSAVPGQSYDRISGTSMACPNLSGVAALLREYVRENFPEIKDNPVEITACVNRLMMSTADIIKNTNGLPYAVRKQGAGLANLNNAANTPAYILTYDRETGEAMDKTKIELGDDPLRTGVYELTFSICNFGSSTVVYQPGVLVMTEGVSDTKTSHGETTVTEQGYALSGTTLSMKTYQNCTINASGISVAPGATATLTVTLKLSDADKAYMDASFENGMYVEGFLVLDAVSGTDVDLSAPYLAFYGDWTQAPLFDRDFFETSRDELDDSIPTEDKNLPDAYATRPIGGLSDDYVSYLGSYYFQQNPNAAKIIAANRDYVAISNQSDAVNSLRFVWAGLLRNAARVEITITESSTGEVVFRRTENDVRKSYGDGGSIYPANIKIEFSAIENQLKNNTAYIVTVKGYLDYGDGGENTNLNNTFSFPLVTDFEAPAVTDCEFYTEYDKSAKKTRLYAKIAVYDNHYSMAAQVGYVSNGVDSPMLHTFDQYLTPIYSNFNGTSYIVYELTDHINEIRTQSLNRNTFTVVCYDYAMNYATYEIELPDDFGDFYFDETTEGYVTLPTDVEDSLKTSDAWKAISAFAGRTALVLSPNQIYSLTPSVYPDSQWSELLEYSVVWNTQKYTDVARVVNNKLVAESPGFATVTAYDPVSKKTATTLIWVISEEDAKAQQALGLKLTYKRYDKPVVESFTLDGYYTDKAYYYLASEDRDLGMTGDERKFISENYSLSMFPSEAVTLRYTMDAYFPEDTQVTFVSSNKDIVTVDENGKIIAVSEGYASVSIRILMDGKSTYYSKTISITVKDPYITTGPSLTHYFGNGGKVHIPSDLAITEIGQYAFSNFDYIPKTEEDEISEEEPDYTKIWFIGDDTIEEVVIPEGVKSIGPYAFANLTKLKKITLPSTLEKIDYGAFYGCTSLQTVVGLENVKFINQNAFYGCDLQGEISLNSATAVANLSFAGNVNLERVSFSETIQSIGAYAFFGNTALKSVTIAAPIVKLSEGAFMGCESLTEISINAAVIPAGTFDGCKKLETVHLGKDVAVLSEYAFRGTAVKTFTVAEGNTALKVVQSGSYITDQSGSTLLLVFPSFKGEFVLNDSKITTVGHGAFSANKKITSVKIPSVTKLSNFAFAQCTALETVTLGALTEIGDYAFFDTALKTAPSFASVTSIGKYSFAMSDLSAVTIPAGMQVGESAFRECQKLATVVIGDNAVIGADAFRLDNTSSNNWTYDYYQIGSTKYYYYVYKSPLHSLTIGKNVTVGDGAFHGAAELESVTLGEGAILGDKAFYNADKLKNIDLSKVTSIGKEAFSGDILYVFLTSDFNPNNIALDEEGYYIYTYYAPDFAKINLSALTYLGENAFAYCHELEEVTLGSGLTEIATGAFNDCKKLEKINLESVENVGENAFAQTGLISVDLSAAKNVGKYAFVSCEKLTSVKLNANGTQVEEGAFAYCSKLKTVENDSAMTTVGNYAFAYTALTKADLSSATYIGEHAFMKETLTDFAVKLGKDLESMGDNPFAMCRLEAFTSVVTETFNGKEFSKETNTFDLNEHIRIIDGCIYRVVPNGLELISYAGDAKNVWVAEGTVRISARAFEGSAVESVMLPTTLQAIGHKAFYACEKLHLVSMTGYKAPILEEEYDPDYFYSKDNIPATGVYTFYALDGVTVIEKNGLELVPYFMWNGSDLQSNVYYGANFVDYIGYLKNPIVMVRPMNGKYYDSFIFDQYFGVVIDGEAAADATTLKAIAAIKLLPDKITLKDKALVLAAREAYDLIATMEQKALVTEYNKLVQAEKRIKDLESLDLDINPLPEDPSTEEPTAENSGAPTYVIVLIAVGVALMAAGLAIALILRKRNALAVNEEEIPALVEICTVGEEKTQEDSENDSEDA